MLNGLKNYNFWVLLAVDAGAVVLSYFLAYYLRFDGNIPPSEISKWMSTVMWITPLKVGCFFFFGLYKGMWRYTGLYDLEKIVKACVVSSTIAVFILVIKVRFEGFPRSVFVIDLILTFLFLSGTRVGIRLLLTPGHGQFRIPFFGKEISAKNTDLKQIAKS